MKKYYWIVLVLFFPSIVLGQSIVINEVMASNQKTILDENGDASDWIELYNRGTSTVSLTGYFLTDDSLQLRKWVFGNSSIQPGGYLLVYASDKNRQAPVPHTNFKISASGESILLSNPNGVIIDRIDIPVSVADISYGRTSDGSLPWIFQTPTPGSQNTGKKIGGMADPIVFSMPAGFYTSTPSVALTAGTSTIFYTLDGSRPDSTKTRYSGPISLTKTTVLRALSLKSGYVPTPPVTRTYFINESTTLPVISLTADPYDLFDPSAGIYPNFTMDWERAAHVEFFEDDRRLGFSEDCGINIHGTQSANWPQKSFAVKFKQEYGISRIDYPLFPGVPVTLFDSFVLRNSGNDFQYTHIRDALMQRLVRDLNIDYLEYRPATSFVNGQYWGIYNIREKVSEHYVANRYGVDPDSIDMLENNMMALHGDSLHYRRLIDYISTHDMSTAQIYAYLDSVIDLNECILYFAAQAYYDNMDWPGTNIKFWRERNPNGQWSKWRWILYDLDFGFGLYAHGAWEDHIAFMFSLTETRYSNPPWATLLQRKLVQNPIIRNRFINQIADLLNTSFKSARVVDSINAVANHIASELPKHRARWGLTGENLTKMITFANDRPAYLRTHVRNYFDCGLDGTITIQATGNGSVQLNTLTLPSTKMPFSGVYFQGNAVHLRAIPSPGCKFVGWSGDISSKSDTLSFTVGRSTTIAAAFSVDSGGSKGVVINEINYNSSDQFNSGDWIELYNTGSESIDITGWTYQDSDPAHAFRFPTGTILGAGQYVVLVEDSSLFKARFPDIKNFVGQMDFGLSGSGEFMKLTNAKGEGVDSLTYDDQAPWPTEPDGNGATLELIDPARDNARGENWKASVGHGSPGRINGIASAVGEEMNEIVPDSYALMQNYPNPFNPSTAISYQLSAVSFVTLRVYDLLGREVATLFEGIRQPGTYEAVFHGGGLTSGIYLYRLTANNLTAGPAGSEHVFVETKKLMLLK
ncbi:MAG: CotH kinase family protein [Ignavibacteriales bacterium]|nr:CotH kinase family protein [Ignavibacteriales bacterium]